MRDVQARIRGGIDGGARRWNPNTHRERRTNGQPESLREWGQVREQPGAAHLCELPVASRACPAIGLLQSLDPALDVQVPRCGAWIETERLNRNPHLRGPAALVYMRGRVPDAVPVAVVIVAAGIDQRVVPRAAGIDLKDIARPSVEKRIEHDADVVFGSQVSVALGGEGDNARRVRIFADDADVNRLAAGDHADACPTQGRSPLNRLDHREALDRLRGRPCRLVEHSIEMDGAARGSRPQGRWRFRRLSEDQPRKQQQKRCRQSRCVMESQVVAGAVNGIRRRRGSHLAAAVL